MLHFIETSFFTQQIQQLLSDDEYLHLQLYLTSYPTQGDVIQGTGGVRKLRWKRNNQSKRDGIRVIYFFVDTQGRFYMLLAYPKAHKTDLTEQEKQQLRKLTQQLSGEPS